jgi:hypothetical protein
VKVSFDQLRLWYQTLDDFIAEKTRIEKEIYAQLRPLFTLCAVSSFLRHYLDLFRRRRPRRVGAPPEFTMALLEGMPPSLI